MWYYLENVLNHRWIKPRLATDNYSIDRPINFYLKRNSLFFHVFRMSVAYKIAQSDFDVTFPRT